MGDLNIKHRVRADKKKKREERRADKPPLGLVSERRGGRGEADVKSG